MIEYCWIITLLQIKTLHRFGFRKQPCPQRVLHHIDSNIVGEQLFPNMPDNVCLANLAGAIYQKNLRRTRLQVLLSAQFDFVIKHTNSPNQELLCRGCFLPPNTYDCGSFVVNGTAVVGKEQNNPYNRCKSTQKGADSYEISI